MDQGVGFRQVQVPNRMADRSAAIRTSHAERQDSGNYGLIGKSHHRVPAVYIKCKVHTHTHTHAYMHAHTHAYMHARTHTHTSPLRQHGMHYIHTYTH